jgi:hypothetical protein
MTVSELIKKRFITVEEFETIDEHPDYLNEDCGISGTGRGTLYTVYENNNGEYGQEVGEVVVMPEAE